MEITKEGSMSYEYALSMLNECYEERDELNSKIEELAEAIAKYEAGEKTND